MADSVSRLKELLFQQETATLSDLERRLQDIAAAERAARTELGEASRLAQGRIAEGLRLIDGRIAELDAKAAALGVRAAALDARAGTPAALRSSVAEVIDDVIVEARETKQDELSRALAPMMVKVIKAELKNNQAEMVDALYPITGQLVKAYVASAMKELTERMNRRLNSNRFMLRLRSLFSGYSMAELTLAESQQLEIEELYLIRRGSGELLQRWPPAPTRSNSERHMTSVLSAINDYAAQAFRDDGGHLRSFDVDDFTVYLRASPVYLLAAKCRGQAVAGVDSVFDAEFLEAVTRQHAAEASGRAGSEPARQVLADLQGRLQDRVAERHEALARAGLPFNPLTAIVTTAALAIIAGLGWYAYTTWEVETTRANARETIAATKAMDGYPVVLEVGTRGQSISITGVAPSPGAKSQLLARLDEALPGVAVMEKGLAVMPTVGPDLRPQIAEVQRGLGGLQKSLEAEIGGLQKSVTTEIGGLQSTVRTDISGLKAAVKTDIGTIQAAYKRDLEALRREAERTAAVRSLERGQRRLEDALADLKALASRREVAALASGTEATLGNLRTQASGLRTSTPDGAARGSIMASLARSAEQIAAAAATVSGQPAPVRNAADRQRQADIAEIAEEVGLAAERFATVAAAAAQAPAPSAVERLRAFIAVNAVFFANGDDYREPARAQRIIGELAQLTKDARAILRVVGYTDERGGQGRNSPLAQTRADKVANALVALGVPRNRVVTVGRSTGPDISPSTGPDSPNRRVEFEVGFEGEAPAR
jgi:outer membrane protein OmpA-like peptidoglycan-associated protein